MTIRMNRALGWLTVSLLAMATPAFADHHEAAAAGAEGKAAKTEKKAPSPADRAKMAEAHERMAQCLRSSRPMEECRSEMKKACEGMHGEGGCSMGHHGGHGSGMGKGMNGAPSGAQKGKPKAE